jgi:hypothetical protein
VAHPYSGDTSLVNLGAWPEGVPYEPASGDPSLELEAIISGAGARWPAVVLAADAAGRRTGWAARVAVEIAEAWVRSGRRVVLADLCLEAPQLHEHLGAPNAEGVADIVLFGASLHASVQRNAGGSFDFLPAGPYAPEPAAIYRDDHWDRILGQLAREELLLVAYAPLEAEGMDHLVSRIGQAIVLVADPGQARSDSLLPAAALQLVLRSTRPAPAETLPEDDVDEPGAARRPEPEPEWEPDAVAAREVEPPPEPAEATPEPADAPPGQAEPPPAPMHRSTDEEFERIRLPKEGAREQLIADLRQRQRAALMVPPPDAGEAGTVPPAHAAGGVGPSAGDAAVRPPEGGLDVAIVPADGASAVDSARQPLFVAHSGPAAPPEEPDFTVIPGPPRGRLNRGVVVVSLIVVLLLAALAGAWHFWSGQRGAEVPPPAAGTTAGELTAGREMLRFSVAIEAHQDLPSAEARASAMREAEQRFGFYITPILVDGTLYYRVMAGPMADSLTAAAAMEALVESGHKTVASEWDIRATPLSFLLGEYGSAPEAQARVEELLTLAIPSYMVPVGPVDAAEYRVYGGGYAGPSEAAVMRELLQSAGQPDTLVERMGRSSR